ncbi:MAG: hypothetical protein Q3976_09690 [Corynebacterium sp.]|nr:hypothetical protein [Corynebacterium sp.]
MKRLLLLSVLGLVACSSAPTTTGTTWQVTELYDGSDSPAPLGESVAGSLLLTFGTSSLNGETGCGQFQASTSYRDADNIQDAEYVEIGELSFEDAECTGQAQHAHDSLVAVLTPGEYHVRHDASDMIAIMHPESEGELHPTGLQLLAETPREAE